MVYVTSDDQSKYITAERVDVMQAARKPGRNGAQCITALFLQTPKLPGPGTAPTPGRLGYLGVPGVPPSHCHHNSGPDPGLLAQA